MRSRPYVLPLSMLAMFAVAASFPLQIMWLYQHEWSEWQQILNKLTVLNWMVIGASIVTGFLVFSASPWLRIALPGAVILVAINNFFVGYLGTDFSMTSATLGTFGFTALFTPLLRTEVRELIRHPSRRWWRTKTRLRTSVPIFVGGSRQVKVRSETYDLSETGAFLPIEANGFELDERVSICLTLGALQQIRCDARIVRRSVAKGKYPDGVGIEFTNMDWWQRRELKRYIARQL